MKKVEVESHGAIDTLRLENKRINENKKAITKKAIRNKKGITLIALVVTIIVLLILAGVSISMLTGQNGILTQASESKLKSENSICKRKGTTCIYRNKYR